MAEIQMHETSSKVWYRPFGLWLGLTVGFGVFAILVLEATHGAWLDICDEFHEAPTTPLGLSVAIVATGVPVAFALASRSGRVFSLALAAAVLEGLVWWWLFTPQGTC